MTPPLDLDALRAANDARRQRKALATPGRWVSSTVNGGPLTGGTIGLFGVDGVFFGRVIPSPDRDAPNDAIFICAAHNDPVEDHVEALIGEVQLLREQASRHRCP